MILLQNINLPLNTNFSNPEDIALKVLKTQKQNIKSAVLFKKSVDARHKNNIVFCCSFLVEVYNNEKKLILNNKKATHYIPQEYTWLKCNNTKNRPVVVGFGPAGMFAALALAKAGLKPIIIERGESVEARQKTVNEFFAGGSINPESNVQFGEGGAGTFSDGKLNTGIKDIRCREVLNVFFENGAKENILYDSKPHIGTDILVNVVKNIREIIINLGGEIKFNTKLEDIIINNDALVGIQVKANNNLETINCEDLVLAIGHSARDTYKMLKEKGIMLERKAFSVGARIEHLQSDINKALYGDFADNKFLPPADYKLATHLNSGRGVYTFCMCPGGEVINASSEAEMTCVNGMSYSARNGQNANSAVLVEVKPQDLKGDNVLEGIELQRKIEAAAYNKNGVPFCFVGDLLGEQITEPNMVKPTVKPAVIKSNINNVLPEFVTQSIKEALPIFNKKIDGFASPNALLVFPETRSSSPVRILRNDDKQSVNCLGLYPCGEGAGYAGGITSAAVDGLKVAEAIISKY